MNISKKVSKILNLSKQGMRILPLFPLQFAAQKLLHCILQRHPTTFQRLSSQSNASFLIDATDMPFIFLLSANPKNPTINIYRDKTKITLNVSATISGPLLSLMKMVDGQDDGDALFFSREITIQGDTEAVLALRNTLDNLEINLLEEIRQMFGPIGQLFSKKIIL